MPCLQYFTTISQQILFDKLLLVGIKLLLVVDPDYNQ